MKSQRKSHAGRGAVIGFGIFGVLSALCLLTPLRPHVLSAAGRETAALQYELRAERDTMDVLQARGSSVHLTPAERASLEQAREAYVATRERIDARERMNERFSMLGLFDWIHELYPWLLAFGLALPALGGLVGAQLSGAQAGGTQTGPASSRPAASPAASGAAPVPPVTPPPPPLPRPSPGVVPRAAYVHPATAAAAAAMAAAPSTPAPASAAPAAPPATPAFTPALRPLPGSPVVLPPDILAPATPKTPGPSETASEPPASAENTDWGFRHQPTPMESRPRPRMPPVRSPHLTDPDVTDPDEHSGV